MSPQVSGLWSLVSHSFPRRAKGAVKREFGRIVYTGTMGGRQQIVRPAHEVAVGIWLAYLQRN